MENEQKNFLLAMVLSGFILLAYYVFVIGPQNEARHAAQLAEQEAQAAAIAAGEIEAPAAEITFQARDEVLADNSIERIKIDTPSLKGSFRVKGSRFDDVELKNYKATLDADSGNVIMLTPEAAEKSAYIFDNWVAGNGRTGTDTPWRVVSGEVLTPETPIVLAYQGEGFAVERTVTIDDRYLITLSDKVSNISGGELELTRRGAARQHGLPDGLINFMMVQEGPVAVVDDHLDMMKYKKLAKQRKETHLGEAGWAGLTDIYWLQAVVAPQKMQIETVFDFRQIDNRDVYEAGYVTQPLTLSADTTIESVGHIFVGAKDRALLESYEADYGISEFERAIDYGRLRILVRPMMKSLNWLGKTLGNQGLGILALTFIIKIFLFPLFNKQYASQAKMKKVQPKLKKIQNLYKDDRAKLQQEMMALYKKEGVNPMAGCLPIIPTMFVFFALYKTVLINVDLRHAPFYGWLQDLSARDPLSILNGFGILPWGPEPLGLTFLAIGPLALMYGVTMAFMQMLTPMPGATAPDEGASDMAQAMQMNMKIFKYLPWIFMFIMAPFAAGLLLYWVWNNILSFIQQYIITRKFKVDTPIDKFYRKITGKPDPEHVG